MAISRRVQNGRGWYIRGHFIICALLLFILKTTLCTAQEGKVRPSQTVSSVITLVVGTLRLRLGCIRRYPQSVNMGTILPSAQTTLMELALFICGIGTHLLRLFLKRLSGEVEC